MHMFSLKDRLTLAIAESAQAILDESAFDDAALKWADQGDKDNIKAAIDSFKQLKARSLLRGAEADISPWIKKPFKDFLTFVNSKSKILQKKDVNKQIETDVEHIFENDLVTIISPNTFEASKKYGAGTKWCISGKVKDHWDDYTLRNIKFYFILPKANNDKIAVAVYPTGSTKEVYDVKDDIMSNRNFQKQLKAYKIPENIIKVIHSNELNWNRWLQNIGGIRNEDGTVDVNGNVSLANMHLTKLPFTFRNVTGNFSCNYNQLKSLEGAPKSVGGGFYCHSNQLMSLEGAPTNIDGTFSCANNQLTSLEGAPKSVGGDFVCSGNNLTSLEGAPSSINRIFDCQKNKLTSLEGAPKSVGGNFYCNNNQLTTLVGAPTSVNRGFDCSHNQLTSLVGAPKSLSGDFGCNDNQLRSLEGAPSSVGGNFTCYINRLRSLEGAPSSVGANFNCSGIGLTSLEGAPKSVGGDFVCSGNKLTSLEGAPKSVGGDFHADFNKVKFTTKQVKAVSNVKRDIYV